jgi:hypothetical protein
MKPRILWFLGLLIVISLSCNLFTPGHTAGVTSVSVIPKSGSGNFKASVVGQAHEGDRVHCYIPVDDENGKRVQQVDVFTSGPISGTSDSTEFHFDIPFTYSVPGTHSLVCTLGDPLETAWSADFTVTSTSQPQAPSGDQTLKPEQFKTATLSYLSYKNQTDPAKGGPPYWCFTGDVSGGNPIPPLTVAPDGSITGQCQGAFRSGSISINYSGTTRGQWNPQTGEMTWSMDMIVTQASGPFSSTRTISLQNGSSIPTASAGEVSATGAATWSDSCQSADGEHPYCSGTQASYLWSGALDWKITFNP